MLRPRKVCWVTVAVACGMAAVTASASATTYEVTRTGDPTPGRCKASDCSLREAIGAANSHSGADKIRLSSSKSAYTLHIPSTSEDSNADGDLDITGPLSISHPGAGRSTIDAAHIDRAFDIQAHARSVFRSLKLTAGDLPDAPESDGGAIRTRSDLTLISSAVTHNHADGTGGGIAALGSAGIQLIDTTVSHNRSGVDGDGGGVAGGTGRISIKHSRFNENHAGGSGGGLYFGSAHDSPIAKTTFDGNSSAVGGGAVEIGSAPTTDALYVTGSTFSDNRTSGNGGAIEMNGQVLYAFNATFSGNQAGGNGGAISRTVGYADLDSTTVAYNHADSDADGHGSGGGLYTSSTYTPFPGRAARRDPPAVSFGFENALLVHNHAALTPDDCNGEGSFGSGGATLTQTYERCDFFVGFGDIVRRHPRIGRLRDNGGPTETIALRKNSPAVDRKREKYVLYPKHDQRGSDRDNRPDIGAYER